MISIVAQGMGRYVYSCAVLSVCYVCPRARFEVWLVRRILVSVVWKVLTPAINPEECELPGTLPGRVFLHGTCGD